MERIKKAKFDIGDRVTILSSKKSGVVKKIVSYLGDGDNIYLVEVDGAEKVCVEANLKVVRKNNIAINLNVTELGTNIEIEDRIRDIIELLELKQSDEKEEQLLNASKLQTYLVLNDDYEENNKMVGNSVIKNQLYHGLINGHNDSIINSYIFSEVLKRIGMNVLNVGLNNEDGIFHMANLVLIGKEYYYFDVTLEMAVFYENGAKKDEFILCCGALGRKSYEQFFKPLCVLEFNEELGPDSLPNNIAEEDIDIDLVNKLLLIGNNGNEK